MDLSRHRAQHSLNLAWRQQIGRLVRDGNRRTCPSADILAPITGESNDERIRNEQGFSFGNKESHPVLSSLHLHHAGWKDATSISSYEFIDSLAPQKLFFSTW
jgi:hypothetical protein